MFYKGYLVSNHFENQKHFFLIHPQRFSDEIIGKTDFPSQAIKIIDSFDEFPSRKRKRTFFCRKCKKVQDHVGYCDDCVLLVIRKNGRKKAA